MNSLDLYIFIPILIGFVFGLFKGLIKELTGLAAIILGIIVALRFEAIVSDKLLSQFNLNPNIVQALSYGIIFIIIAILLLIVARMLNKLLSSISLGGLNSFLGGVFGALKYALIISVLLNVFNLLDKNFKLLDSETKEKSLIYNTMIGLGPKVWNETKEFFDQQSNDTDNKSQKPDEKKRSVN